MKTKKASNKAEQAQRAARQPDMRVLENIMLPWRYGMYITIYDLRIVRVRRPKVQG